MVADSTVFVGLDLCLRLWLVCSQLHPTQVGKITGKEGLTFSGPAKVFDQEEDVMVAIANNEIEKGMVIVIRYEGPKGE